VIRLFPLGLAVVLAVASAFHAHAASVDVKGSAHVSDATWRLGATDYPKGTKIITTAGVSNAHVQHFAGGLHATSYAALGRMDRRGWLQSGTFTVVTGHGSNQVKHVLSWSYAVSYYRTSAAAVHAVSDIRKKTQLLPDVGPYGRIARFLKGAGYRETFSTLGQGTTVIEMLCGIQRHDVHQFGGILGQYCSEQRLALSRLTTTQTASITPTPAVTTTPIAASLPATATASDSLPAPTLSFYTQGSQDTCVLTGETTSFPNTIPEMFVKALFSDWQGNHQIDYEWYAPDGSLFYNTAYSGTDLGSAVLCAWMTIGDTDAATLPGTWTLRLRIDGQESVSATFSLTDAVTPDPVAPLAELRTHS
jgi:hypothetical protein